MDCCGQCGKCGFFDENIDISQEEKKNLNQNINIINEQVEKMSKMIDNNIRYEDILIHISDIKKTINAIEEDILENHLKNHVAYEVQQGNLDVLDETMNLIKKYVK